MRNNIIIAVALLLLFTGDWTFWAGVLSWASIIPPTVPTLTWFLVSVGCLVSGIVLGTRLQPEVEDRRVVVNVVSAPKDIPFEHTTHHFRPHVNVKEFDLI